MIKLFPTDYLQLKSEQPRSWSQASAGLIDLNNIAYKNKDRI